MSNAPLLVHEELQHQLGCNGGIIVSIDLPKAFLSDLVIPASAKDLENLRVDKAIELEVALEREDPTGLTEPLHRAVLARANVDPVCRELLDVVEPDVVRVDELQLEGRRYILSSSLIGCRWSFDGSRIQRPAIEDTSELLAELDLVNSNLPPCWILLACCAEAVQQIVTDDLVTETAAEQLDSRVALVHGPDVLSQIPYPLSIVVR